MKPPISLMSLGGKQLNAETLAAGQDHSLAIAPGPKTDLLRSIYVRTCLNVRRCRFVPDRPLGTVFLRAGKEQNHVWGWEMPREHGIP